MNGKQAKALRRAAGYTSQTATPGVMDFPGVARFVRHPKFETHTATKTSYIVLPGDAKPTKVETEVQRLTHDRHGKPVALIEANPDYGKPIPGTDGLLDAEQFRPAFDLVPNSKPGRLRPTEPKGVYRSLKRLFRQGLLDAAAKAEEFLDELTSAPEVRAEIPDHVGKGAYPICGVRKPRPNHRSPANLSP